MYGYVDHAVIISGTNIGDNLSTPKNGSCAEDAELGQDGCTWRRLPVATIIYYADLLTEGWDPSLPHDTSTDSSGSLHAIEVMAKAWKRVERFLTPRCCGC
jgi:hypothetical protein